LAWQGLSGQQSGTALVRISTNLSRTNENIDEAALQDFTRAIKTDLEQYLP